jgi:hypothetical protein
VADGKASIVLSAVDKTRAAFESAKRNMAALKSEAAGIVSGFGQVSAVIGTLGVGLAGLSFRNVVDGLDRLNDVKDATGSSIENISALEDIGARTGTTFESVETTLVRFNKVLSDAKPDNDIGLILKEIGLSAEELRKLDPAEALREVAVALSEYADDGNKARVFQELFGKSVKEVAPFLKDLAEAGKLNATVTTQQAEAAEAFNKQIFALQKNIEDAARTIFSDLIPALNSLFTSLTKAKGAAAGGSLLDGILGTNPVDRLRSQNQEIAAEVTRAGDQLGRLVEEQNRQGGPGSNQLLDGRVNKARQKLDGLRTKAAETSEQLKNLADIMDGGPQARQAEEKKPEGKKPSLPVFDADGKKQGAADAEAAARRALDGRIKAIQAGADAERDALAQQERVQKSLYDLGETNLSEFYSAQDRLREENIASVRRSAKAEIDELERAKSKATKPQDRAELDNRIADVRSKADAAQRESDQAAELSGLERRKTTAALIEQVTELDARIKTIAGDDSGAAIIENARQVAQARRLLRDAGDDPGKADQLAQALDVQRQFNVAQREFASLTQQASNAEERLVIQAREGGKGLLATESEIRGVREKSVAQLGGMIERVKTFAATSKDPSVLQYLDDLQTRYEQLQATVDPTKLRLDAAADNIGDAVADGLERAVVEGEKLSDILDGIGRDITAIVTREVITKPIADSISGFVRGAGGQGTGQNLIGQLFGLNSAKPQASNILPGESAGVPDAGGFLGGFLGGADSIVASFTSLATSTTAQVAASGAATAANTTEATSSAAATTALGGLTIAAQSAATALASIAASGGSKALGDAASLFQSSGDSSFLASFFHEGGVVAEGNDFRQVFGAAPRYHTGGLAGLKPDEVPAVLLKNEEVLTRDDPRHRDNLSTKVFERIQSMKEGASLASLDGFDLSGIKSESIVSDKSNSVTSRIERMASDKSELVERDDEWSEVERYHTGGIAGLAADEVPAVLKKGEEVLTEADPRHRDNFGGGTTVEQHFHFHEAKPSRQTMSQVGAEASRGLRNSERNL